MKLNVITVVLARIYFTWVVGLILNEKLENFFFKERIFSYWLQSIWNQSESRIKLVDSIINYLRLKTYANFSPADDVIHGVVVVVVVHGVA